MVSQVFMITALVVGIVLVLLYKLIPKEEIRPLEGFFVVVLSWLGISFLSSLPFHFSGEVGYIDAWVEACSAITTTGIEFLGGIENWPKSLLWYRHQLELFGGIGIIIMTIALLALQEGALLSVYYSEFGKDVRDVRVTPRLTSTARVVFLVYSVLWLTCAFFHIMAGVPIYIALIEAMATVSTGGFSTKDIYPIYASTFNQWVAIVFMILGAMGFHIHYLVLKKKSLSVYTKYTEMRVFLMFLVLGVVLVLFMGQYPQITRVIFDVTAFITTTGFETQVHTSSSLLMVMFTVFGLIGACAGSTAGGIKFIRVSILWQEAKTFLKRMLYPNLVQNISLDGKVLPVNYVANVRGYIALFIITFMLAYMVLLGTGLVVEDAFYILAATITNVGASVHRLPVLDLTGVQKFVLSIIMLLGRVEIAAFMLVCMPRYWRS